MRYVSLFSGIEAASYAWDGLGFEPVAFSEIEPFPCAVLRERYPHVPNLGDVTQIDWEKVVEEHGSVDLVVGGSPCQSFSVAGGREGLDGASGLMWEYVRAVRELRPRWLLWENVPGALSSRTRDAAKGDDYRCLLSALDDLGYGMAWDVLDAQFFGVAQRRRRLFVVGRLGDPWSAAEVLFEPESLRWDSPTGKQKRQELAELSGRGAGGSYTLKLRHTGSPNPGGMRAFDTGGRERDARDQPGPDALPGVEGCLNPWDNETSRVYAPEDVSPTLKANPKGGFNSGAVCYAIQGDVARGAHMGQNSCGYKNDGTSYTLNTMDQHAVAYGFSYKASSAAGSIGLEEEVAPSLLASRHDGAVAYGSAQNCRDEVRLVGGGGQVSGALAAQPGMKQTTYVCKASTQAHAEVDVDLCGTLSRRSYKDAPVICAQETVGDITALDDMTPPQKANQARSPQVIVTTESDANPCYIVRRLMPVECERLQGFPDGWTDIEFKGKPASDSARYKALGNSMAVPVMRWLGERIKAVDSPEGCPHSQSRLDGRKAYCSKWQRWTNCLEVGHCLYETNNEGKPQKEEDHGDNQH